MSKKIIIGLFVLFISSSAKSQDINRCREIIKQTFQSVNSQSISNIEKYLSDDFETANQKGKIAKLVLKQLISQLNDSIIEYKEQEILKNDTAISFNYTLKYQKHGDKQASFTFNNKNKIRKLELLKIKVKRLDNSKQNVKFPKNNVLSVPFETYGKLIGVNVSVNGENRLFILDTGSPKTILNMQYFNDKNEDEEHKETFSSKKTKGINGTINNLNIYKVNDLDFYGIKYTNQQFLTMDLSHLEEALKIKIGGLIGYETVKNYDILFDYRKKLITLIKPEYFEQYKEKITILSRTSVKLEKHIPIVASIINNKIYFFGIDCGAEANMIDRKLYNDFKNYLRRIKKDTLSGADKNRKEVISAKLKKMYIAEKKYKNMKTVFNDISPFAKGYKIEINGLLGYEFLSKYRTLISYKRKELLLIK